ncbi:MAG: hypothetical protein ACOZIN_09155 [Myxococcota bacterium]
MATTRARILEALEKVASALGPDVANVVFLGATASALYPANSLTDIRPTNDVDLLVRTSLAEYYALMARLKERGFEECRDEGAPTCRRRLGDDLQVDVMVPDPEVLGFSNKWYPEAFDRAASYPLPSGRPIRAITPIYFLATKLEAFRSRGKGDFRSKDIEDIVLMLDGNPDVLHLVQEDDGAAASEVKDQLAQFARNRDFEDAVFGCFPGDNASQGRAAAGLARLLQAVS